MMAMTFVVALRIGMVSRALLPRTTMATFLRRQRDDSHEAQPDRDQDSLSEHVRKDD